MVSAPPRTASGEKIILGGELSQERVRAWQVVRHVTRRAIDFDDGFAGEWVNLLLRIQTNSLVRMKGSGKVNGVRSLMLTKVK